MTNQTAHIHILLDRSCYRASIAPEVIGGLNTFLAAQQADGPIGIGPDACINHWSVA